MHWASNNRNNPGRWLYIAKLKPLALSEHPILPVSTPVESWGFGWNAWLWNGWLVWILLGKWPLIKAGKIGQRRFHHMVVCFVIVAAYTDKSFQEHWGAMPISPKNTRGWGWGWMKCDEQPPVGHPRSTCISTLDSRSRQNPMITVHQYFMGSKG